MTHIHLLRHHLFQRVPSIPGSAAEAPRNHATAGEAELGEQGPHPALSGRGGTKQTQEIKTGPRFKKGSCSSKPQGCLDASCSSEGVLNTREKQDSESPAPKTRFSTENIISDASAALGPGMQPSSASIHGRAEPLTHVTHDTSTFLHNIKKSVTISCTVSNSFGQRKQNSCLFQ